MYAERACALQQQDVKAAAIDEQTPLVGVVPLLEVPVPVHGDAADATEKGTLDIDATANHFEERKDAGTEGLPEPAAREDSALDQADVMTELGHPRRKNAPGRSGADDENASYHAYPSPGFPCNRR